MIEIPKLLTWGILNWINDNRSDYLALSVKTDASNAFTAMKRMVVSHPQLIPVPDEYATLYVYADQRMTIEGQRDGLIRVDPTIYLVKRTQIESSGSSPALITYEMPIMQAIARKMALDACQLGDTMKARLHYTDSTGTHTYPSTIIQEVTAWRATANVISGEVTGGSVYAIWVSLELELVLSMVTGR